MGVDDADLPVNGADDGNKKMNVHTMIANTTKNVHTMLKMQSKHSCNFLVSKYELFLVV